MLHRAFSRISRPTESTRSLWPHLRLRQLKTLHVHLLTSRSQTVSSPLNSPSPKTPGQSHRHAVASAAPVVQSLSLSSVSPRTPIQGPLSITTSSSSTRVATARSDVSTYLESLRSPLTAAPSSRLTAPPAEPLRAPSNVQDSESVTTDLRWYAITAGVKVGVYQGWY